MVNKTLREAVPGRSANLFRAMNHHLLHLQVEVHGCLQRHSGHQSVSAEGSGQAMGKRGQ